MPPTVPKNPHQKTLYEKGGMFRSPAKRFLSAEVDKMESEEENDDVAQRYKGLPLSGKSKCKHAMEETALTTKRTTLTQEGQNVSEADLREHATQMDDGDQSS